jgi:hypothetical protein
MAAIDTEKLAEILVNNGYGANIHLTQAICELVEAAEGILDGAFGGQSELKHRLLILDDEIKDFVVAAGG